MITMNVTGALRVAAIFGAALLRSVVVAEGNALSWPYDESFKGDGTYYGPSQSGHCSITEPIPSMYNGMVAVALNGAQYADSFMCGACIEGRGTGGGSGHNPIGEFRAYVTDSCMGCAWGDLDFAESGDGRWDIEWKFVPCPGGEPHFEWQGSHQWYWKIQARGTTSPVEELFVNHRMAQKVTDNFFVMTEGVPLIGKQLVETKTILGDYHAAEVSL